ncbi:unnamed protein product, partial [Phaeothamnion confervicola]
MSNRDDHIVSVLSGNREVVVKAITARNLVQDALIKQDLRPLAADALGRVMICTLLMSSGLKDQETLQLTFQGDGPLQGVMAISDGEGGIRGYVGDGRVSLPYNENGRPDVSTGIGSGLLKVIRNHPEYERPYSGIVKLRNSEVAFDVAGYLKDSEQKSTAIAAGVAVDGAVVRQAGGWLIETLPGASDETERLTIRNLQSLINDAEDPSLLLGAGLTPTGLATRLLEGLGGIDSITVRAPSYKCHCSSERVYRALRLLGVEEVRSIVKENEIVEVSAEKVCKSMAVAAE